MTGPQWGALALLVVFVGLLAVQSADASSAATDSGPVPDPGDGAAEAEDLPVDIMDGDANVAAFLGMISWAEGTTGHGDPYRVCYAYSHTVQDMSEHPAITGEWRGEVLSDAICDGAGVPRGSVSTAAGRYQIRVQTWKEARSGAGVRDFSPASQDAAAVWLIKNRCRALDDVRAGRFADALRKVGDSRQWASLPGANYGGQGMRSVAQLEKVYTGTGGTIA